MSEDQKEYCDSLIRIISDELPIIAKYNTHLYQLIRSGIELVLDQSQKYFDDSIQISEKTKKEVDEIIAEIEKE